MTQYQSNCKAVCFGMLHHYVSGVTAKTKQTRILSLPDDPKIQTLEGLDSHAVSLCALSNFPQTAPPQL